MIYSLLIKNNKVNKYIYGVRILSYIGEIYMDAGKITNGQNYRIYSYES